MNEVYSQFFPKNFPARSAFKVAGLALMPYVKRKNPISFGGGQRSFGVTGGPSLKTLLTQYLENAKVEIECIASFRSAIRPLSKL
ncbi:hypothetical protein HOLleu_23004 [Holothuria leucospilota]|uniref:Uncharacterized protein n=1 Tax=Holothuria leucospilota TaxID=206669 RepID=A0A9Q1BTJ1_HOLLE|nr:hypothetical protein HOLleu_23004 [Holothuria leucospilota]